MKQIIFILIPIFLLISCCGNPKPSSGVPNKATDFTLEQLGGSKVTLSELKGKVVLVDFWATWCPPCRAAIPHLIQMYNTYKDSGLIVLGISLDQEKDKLPSFIKDNNITYPILYGNSQVAIAYNVQSIPTLVIFDKKGKIIFREVGFNEENVTTLKQKVMENLHQ